MSKPKVENDMTGTWSKKKMNQIKCTVAVKKSLFLLGKKKHSQGLGEQGTCAFISGEQRSKNEGNRGPMAILGNGEHRKSTFLFLGAGEQSDLFQGNKDICNFAGKA